MVKCCDRAYRVCVNICLCVFPRMSKNKEHLTSYANVWIDFTYMKSCSNICHSCEGLWCVSTARALLDSVFCALSFFFFFSIAYNSQWCIIKCRWLPFASYYIRALHANSVTSTITVRKNISLNDHVKVFLFIFTLNCILCNENCKYFLYSSPEFTGFTPTVRHVGVKASSGDISVYLVDIYHTLWIVYIRLEQTNWNISSANREAASAATKA